jgi:hypothetical protein
MGLSEKQYQIAADLARNCRVFSISRLGHRPPFRCPFGTPSDLINRIPVSIDIGLCEAAGVELGLDERALPLAETLVGF